MSQQEKPATHCGLFFRFEFYEKARLGVICTETVQKLERTMRNARKIVKFWTLMSLALSVTALTASAQIYKSVAENGVVTFSDTPPSPSANTQTTIVKPNATNSIPAIEVPVAAATSETITALTPRTIAISSPKDNATIPMGAGIFDVTAELTSPLAEGEQLALYLDGTLVDTPQTSNVWTLSYVLRGPHTLQVRRLSSSGETASESEVITVFVLRPSVLKAAPR